MSSELSEIATKSAAEMGRAIGAGALDPVDLTEHYLEQAAASEAIYVRLTPERARREAKAARERAKIGLRRGPLDGVPISWKDLVDMAGQPTEAGSKLRQGVMAVADAPVLARASRAGLVALGKTHLSEFAFSGLGYNPMTATSPNFYDRARVPGGSSSGGAASVAFGLAAATIGSDTGGSVRVPSAWNGLVGLKTTAGLVPTEGVTPLAPSLDTIGPLTRTVEDAALLYAVLAGKPAPDLTGAETRGLSFVAPEDGLLDDMNAGLRAAFETQIERLAAAGARIRRAPIPEFAAALEETAKNGGIVNTEGYAIWKDVIEADPGKMFPFILDRFRSGARFTADQIDHARLTLIELTRSYLARTAGADAVLMPTTPIPAPLIADIAEDEARYTADNMAALRFTRLGNLLGLSGLALPAGMTSDGQPASLMLMGAPFAEVRLLRVGSALMRSLT